MDLVDPRRVRNDSDIGILWTVLVQAKGAWRNGDGYSRTF
jgi:hypothetical protein